MFKKIVTLIALAVLFSSLPKFAKASHVAGGEITYTCLGGNQYQINLNLFIDCLGFNPGVSQTINLSSSCGGFASLTVDSTGGTTGGLEISQLCPAQISQSTCNGGTLPGMWLFSYTGVVSLAPACDTWTMSWSTCCTNSAITNLATAGSGNFYIEATLNSATAPCNSSPQFTAQPIPYVCVNQPVNYSYGVIETDGDSLYYSIIPALDGAGVNATYNVGYSGTSPIPGITINPNTGLVTFTGTTLGNFVVAMLVKEYDANGNYVGSVMRNIQFVVQNCTNVVPSPSAGTLSGFSGNAVQTGPYSLEMCAGNNFNFNSTYTDTDASNVLTFTSNIAAALPGATITQTSATSNPLVLAINWNSPPGSQGQNLTFTVTISDGACPIEGQQTYVYNVNILDATTANADLTICGNQSAQLHAFGGSQFNWSVVSGPGMTPANFSCNPCANPVASPSATTTYALLSNLSGTCDNKDTVTVFVVQNFNYNITQSSTSSCLLQPIQLGITNLSPAGPGYNYHWAPAVYLSNTSIANPIANITTPGTYTYTVTVTNPFGCVKKDSLTISIIPAISPTITAYSDTTFCSGQTATLGLNFGNGVPANCGLSASTACSGASFTTIVGTGTASNSSTTWPAPYGNWYTSAKQQYLYTAADLNAAGIMGGKINQLDFNVTTITGITTYHEYTIKMGCTNLSSLGTTWVPGLVQVFNPQNVSIALGWNSHIFNNAFEWDGISNVVIEICFNEATTAGVANYTYSSSSSYTATAYTSCLYSYSDNFDMCPDLTNLINQSFDRPNTRFHYCSVSANPASYSYLWAPASGNIANSTIQNTTAQPTATTTFTVTVTDIAGGCSTTDSVQVNVVNINTLTVTPAGPYCVNGTIDTLQVSVPLGSGTWAGPGITNANLGVFNPAIAGAGAIHQIIYTVNGNCGTAADTINIVVTPQPDATITQVGQQCLTGPPITLIAATSGGIWTGAGITNPTTGLFDPAIAGIGNHTITYALTLPCSSQDTMIIAVVSQLNSTITHVGPFCTSHIPITLSAVDVGGIWSGNGITNSATGIFDPSVSGAGSHTITYTIPGLCGSVDTDVIDVTANPVISFTTDKKEGCEPTTVSFTSTENPAGGTCAWTFGDGNSSSICNPSNTYMVANSYDVSFTYTIPPGCSTTITKNDSIIIHSQPFANFIATPQPTSIANPEVHFVDYSTGQINSWNWTFGLLGTSAASNPSFVFPDTGSYPVQLIVSNIYGCADTIPGTVIIDPIVTFYSPNAFTPDGNGLNDLFMVQADGLDYKNFEILIFDRWGERVYKSTDIFEGWNGKLNNSGEPLKQDVYVWKVYFKDFKGNKHYYIGHVTIMR